MMMTNLTFREVIMQPDYERRSQRFLCSSVLRTSLLHPDHMAAHRVQRIPATACPGKSSSASAIRSSLCFLSASRPMRRSCVRSRHSPINFWAIEVCWSEQTLLRIRWTRPKLKISHSTPNHRIPPQVVRARPVDWCFQTTPTPKDTHTTTHKQTTFSPQ